MINTLLTFGLILFLLLLPLFFCARLLGRETNISYLAGLLLKEAIMGMWHWVFGAKKVRVVRDRR